MASGFKSVNNSPVKIPKALSIAIAQALTKKMESIFKEIEDPRIEQYAWVKPKTLLPKSIF